MTHIFVTVAPKKARMIQWPVCSRCGLIALRNKRSQRAVRAQCSGKDDQ